MISEKLCRMYEILQYKYFEKMWEGIHSDECNLETGKYQVVPSPYTAHESM